MCISQFVLGRHLRGFSNGRKRPEIRTPEAHPSALAESTIRQSNSPGEQPDRLLTGIEGQPAIAAFGSGETVFYQVRVDVPELIPGDFNVDGEVSTDDVAVDHSDLDAFLAQTGTLAGDANLDGIVDFDDFLSLAEKISTDAVLGQMATLIATAEFNSMTSSF